MIRFRYCEVPYLMGLRFLLLMILYSIAACRTEEGFRYLALGDSYTIGEGVSADQRWPVQLSTMLEQSGIEVTDIEILAETGWTTEELLGAIQAKKPQGPFDLVSLLIGVNNQYRGQSIDLYRQEFRQLLELSVQFAGEDASRVLVLSIPDWGVTPFAADRDRERIAREIDGFNQVNREETAVFGASYIDITGPSREASDDPSMLASDRLHPSGEMYRQWARLVFDRWSGTGGR